MKPKLILLSTLALVGATLATGCSSDPAKTQIGILQFGSFEALEKAKDGFKEVLEKSELKDKIEITLLNPAANSADNATMAATLASSSDLVYGIATPSATALKTSVASLGAATPVLFSAVTNPSGAKLVENLEEPEGNCTGVVDLGPIEEELDILSRFPNIDKIASFFTSTEVNSKYQVDIAEAWMDRNEIEHTRVTITAASEIKSALASIPSDVDAVFLPTDDTIANKMAEVKAANDERVDKLIIVGSDTGMIEGCTFAMGVDYHECGIQAGQMALKILQEKKPIKEIPVERCDTNNLFVNKTLADSLGIEIPSSIFSIPGVVVK